MRPHGDRLLRKQRRTIVPRCQVQARLLICCRGRRGRCRSSMGRSQSPKRGCRAAQTRMAQEMARSSCLPASIYRYPILVRLNFEINKLLKRTLAHWSFRQADRIGAAFPQQRLEESRPANLTNLDCTVSDAPDLEGRAIAMSTDLHANHTLAKGIMQHFAIGCVTAEIGHDQGIVAVAAINLRQNVGEITAVSPAAVRSVRLMPTTPGR